MSENVKYCPKCGKQLGDGAAMCPDCGHMFVRQGSASAAAGRGAVLSEGLMLIFIGMIIELASPALGFAGAGSLVGGIGSFICVGGLIVELLGFAKIRKCNAHFNKAWNYYIGAIACSIGYAIASIVMSIASISAWYTGGYGVIIAMLIIAIIFSIAMAVLDIFRIRELMDGCREVAAENGDNIHAEKCRFAGKFYYITRGIHLAISILILILTLAMWGTLISGGYTSYTGLLVAIGVFGIILIIISCVLIAAQILIIVRIYQTYSKCKTGQFADTGTANGFIGSTGSSGSSSTSQAKTSGASGSGSGSQTAGDLSKSVNERVSELEKKLQEENKFKAQAQTAGTKVTNAGAKVAGAAGAAGAGVASAFGAAVSKVRGAAAGSDKSAGQESNASSAVEEDSVTVIKHPDVELEYIPLKAGTGGSNNKIEDDEEKTVLLDAEGNEGSEVTVKLTGIANGEETQITKDTFTLGRSREKSDHRIDNPSVSSVHARIVIADGKCVVQDLGSSNHTFVNGNEVASGDSYDAGVALQDGDVLKLGNEEFKVNVTTVEKPVENEDKGGYFTAFISKSGEEIKLDKQEFTLGRTGGDADLKVGGNNTVGRIHARIKADPEAGKVFISDETSANGTFVNGEKVAAGEEVELNDNDEIVLSDVTVRFRKA